ncbi:hypothetical protein [Paraglaciecola sp. L3A3]|uniref:hypothetical protein n=1 Tax=Paraglaciecola sp. L3A3 TaxID=2686358 RepID=UPI00131BFDB4|nr:hypothetical protein [Paraglaciecola sp. L3A3]
MQKLIQAKLVFELPKPAEIATPDTEPQIEPEPNPPIPVKTESNQQQPKTIPSAVQPVKQIKSIVEKKPQAVKDIPLTNLATKQAANTQINSQFTGTAGKHLQAFNVQQDEQMAEQARRDYQQQKNSPTLHSSKPNQFVSEEQKLIDKIKIRANCDGLARKTTAVLLGFMGGKIDCTSKPDINGFINKRINKETHLDSKYQQPLSKHPQSLVIQD